MVSTGDLIHFYPRDESPNVGRILDNWLFYTLDTDYHHSQLVCFYMLAPLTMVAFVVGEAWCLFTNELAPLYVVVASTLAILIWALELGFWTACHTKSGDAVPDLCPVIFQNGKDELFKVSGLDFAHAAVYTAAALIVL